jgi:hypothetical protein
MTKSAYLWPFTDAAVLGGRYNSQLVMRLGQRFESARRLSYGLTSTQIRSIPEEPDEKLPGILRFDPEEETTLSLFGSLSAPEVEEGIPILGLSMDNTPITATQTTPAGKAQGNRSPTRLRRPVALH